MNEAKLMIPALIRKVVLRAGEAPDSPVGGGPRTFRRDSSVSGSAAMVTPCSSVPFFPREFFHIALDAIPMYMFFPPYTEQHLALNRNLNIVCVQSNATCFTIV
jgi:hypothetical protein